MRDIYLYENTYKWAGEERLINIVKGERVLGGDTVRYSDVNSIEKDINIVISKLNNIHTMVFYWYVRDALVKASDGVYSEYHYLINIFEDAIENG